MADAAMLIRCQEHAARHPVRAPVPGTLGWIGTANRMHAVAELSEGIAVSLSRQVANRTEIETPGEVTSYKLDTSVELDGRVAVGRDTLTVACHGFTNTHIDALCHVGLDGTWHGGLAVDGDTSAVSIDAWATPGIVTRAVFADIPAARGGGWATSADPVTGAELDRLLDAAGVAFEPGDALLLYMGRNALEAAPPGAGRQYTPAVDASVADWIADRGVSVLCWDLLDCPVHDRMEFHIHLMIWAIGLAIVDNCDFAALRDALRAAGKHTALLTIAPLRIPYGTGSLVNPTALL
jgi:kynurenine formamidase